MLTFFTKWPSVINSIYSGQDFFSYNSTRLANALAYSNEILIYKNKSYDIEYFYDPIISDFFLFKTDKVK
jgi:hypothetical protein